MLITTHTKSIITKIFTNKIVYEIPIITETVKEIINQPKVEIKNSTIKITFPTKSPDTIKNDLKNYPPLQ